MSARAGSASVTGVNGVSWDRKPQRRRPPPSGKITDVLPLKGLRTEHRKLLVDLKTEGKAGIRRENTRNAHLHSN